MKWKQLSFAGGELAPELYGRIDTVKYSTGLATCLNAIAKRTGPVERRPGTKYVCTTKNGQQAQLIKFAYDATDALVLECGLGYVRFIKNGAQLLGEMGYRASIKKDVTPWEVTLASHPYETADTIYFCLGSSFDSIDTESYVVTDTGANTFTLDDTVADPGTAGLTFDCVVRRYGTAADTNPLELINSFGVPINYAQSGSVIFYTRGAGYLNQPCKISRYDDYVWEVEEMSFSPSISAPTNVASASAGNAYYYKITAVKSGTFEESLPSSAAGSANATSKLTWTAVSGAREYNIYKSVGTKGIFGYIGSSTTAEFTDSSISIDATEAPPEAPMDIGDPEAICFYQQRLFFGGFADNIEAVWGSRVGQYGNFTASYPSSAADAVMFSIAARDVQNIKQLVEANALLAFSASGVTNIRGDGDGVITPSTPNAKQITYDGAANVRPVVIGSTVLYVQAKSGGVSDLSFEEGTQSYQPRDLSIYSVHMFDGYTISSWDYHKVPHTCVFAARSDGKLTALTYMKEQEIWGWHLHETEGQFITVVTIPETTVDATYFQVIRDIGGSSVCYIERMADVAYTETINDHWMVDCGLSYSGYKKNPDGSTSTACLVVDDTLPLGGGGWTNADQCYLVASQAIFNANEVGNVYELTLNGESVKLTVEEYNNASSLICRPQKDIPVNLRNPVQITDWYRHVDSVSGLSHLEGKTVVALCDGEAVEDLTVSGGAVSFDDPAANIQVGLPYTTDIVTLPLDNPQKPITDNSIIIQEAMAQIKSTGVFEAGPNLDTLTEPPMRQDENMGDPTALTTGKYSFFITGLWQDSGQVAFRQDKPLPFTLLSLTMKGKVGA